MFSLLRCVYLFGVQNYDVTLRPLYKVQLVPNNVFPPLIIPYFGSYTLHTHTHLHGPCENVSPSTLYDHTSGTGSLQGLAVDI